MAAGAGFRRKPTESAIMVPCENPTSASAEGGSFRRASSASRKALRLGAAACTPSQRSPGMRKPSGNHSRPTGAWPQGRGAFIHAMKNSLGEKVWVRGLIQAHLGVSRKKILFAEHHQSHAAAGYFTSPFDHAAVLVVDAIGEWSTISAWEGRGRRLRPSGRVAQAHHR